MSVVVIFCKLSVHNYCNRSVTLLSLETIISVATPFYTPSQSQFGSIVYTGNHDVCSLVCFIAVIGNHDVYCGSSHKNIIIAENTVFYSTPSQLLICSIAVPRIQYVCCWSFLHTISVTGIRNVCCWSFLDTILVAGLFHPCHWKPYLWLLFSPYHLSRKSVLLLSLETMFVAARLSHRLRCVSSIAVTGNHVRCYLSSLASKSLGCSIAVT